MRLTVSLGCPRPDPQKTQPLYTQLNESRHKTRAYAARTLRYENRTAYCDASHRERPYFATKGQSECANGILEHTTGRTRGCLSISRPAHFAE